MVLSFLTKVFGSKNERDLRQLQPLVARINELEPEIQALTDEQLKGQTVAFRQRLEQGEELDSLLAEAFATVREASIRTLNMRHFDVQMIGGMVLHQGKIAEMKTGEGKTLAATLPAYLNALTGRGVHVITVNDYLARRDTEWMGNIYRFLGLSVGTILHGLDDAQRLAAYSSDITYGTNNEFGFDYLRDNMKFDQESLVQGELNFAIVDEVDSILIDEARTPLIISGPAEKSTDLYYQINSLIPRLNKDAHYTIDEKARSAILTEDGVARAENLLRVDNLYDPKYIELLHHINQALKAHTLFKRDVDYIVKNGEVIIVDEFTGRLMPGRRYSEGLHQALEAKEAVKIENENQTLATVTFQNYFRMYNKLAGMTGTADTEATEFKKIYELDVIVIPTNMPMVRSDYPDAIYKSRREKFEAVLDEIEELHEKGQPVLVGTISIDVSESLSKKLKKRGIKHEVLNAKNHEKEAEIIAQAGQMGAVTISTNMAGRGTDIVLGDGVTDLGGLHILGTERHESRRIDNQLRGRSGRQGDPGSSRFFLALEDDLLRIFGGERITGIMEKLGMEEGEPIEHNMISRAIENAQSKVEGHNFDIRKQLLEYDDVMNQQREVIYRQRREALSGKDLKSEIQDMIRDKAEQIADSFAAENPHAEEWDLKEIKDAVFQQFNFRLNGFDEQTLDGLNRDGLAEMIYEEADNVYQIREAAIGSEDCRHLERLVMLQTVDNLWKDHLLSMDHLKEGIGLRGYAQQNPLIVYKKEGYEMFHDMIERIKDETLGILFRIQIAEPEKMDDYRQPRQQQLFFSGGDEGEPKKPTRRASRKIGRNAPCPCGSGKKYKKCCGQ
ncbi:MAG: preprotein translocase subunit SecA [Desulfobacterales bacterium]|nr:preprotein translocase subunit SecA [Desulfobacterales bacterium]